MRYFGEEITSEIYELAKEEGVIINQLIIADEFDRFMAEMAYSSFEELGVEQLFQS